MSQVGTKYLHFAVEAGPAATTQYSSQAMPQRGIVQAATLISEDGIGAQASDNWTMTWYDVTNSAVIATYTTSTAVTANTATSMTISKYEIARGTMVAVVFTRNNSAATLANDKLSFRLDYV